MNGESERLRWSDGIGPIRSSKSDAQNLTLIKSPRRGLTFEIHLVNLMRNERICLIHSPTSGEIERASSDQR